MKLKKPNYAARERLQSIHRSKLMGPYAKIANSLLRDSDLTLAARGALCLFLSHTDDWFITQRHLELHSPEGRERVRSIFRELEERGYLVGYHPARVAGHITPVQWSLHEIPVEEHLRSNVMGWDKPRSKKRRPPKYPEHDECPIDPLPF